MNSYSTYPVRGQTTRHSFQGSGQPLIFGTVGGALLKDTSDINVKASVKAMVTWQALNHSGNSVSQLNFLKLDTEMFVVVFSPNILFKTTVIIIYTRRK